MVFPIIPPPVCSTAGYRIISKDFNAHLARAWSIIIKLAAINQSPIPEPKNNKTTDCSNAECKLTHLGQKNSVDKRGTGTIYKSQCLIYE